MMKDEDGVEDEEGPFSSKRCIHIYTCTKSSSSVKDTETETSMAPFDSFRET